MISSCDFENPPVKNILKTVGHKKSNLRHFQYPGRFTKRKEGEDKADRRKLALKSRLTLFYGESSIRRFTAGHWFNLSTPVLRDLDNKPYLIKELKIEATATSYKNSFVALPLKQPYLPLEEENVQKPVIFGSQTAVVVGEKETGSVHSNSAGRVRVRFHWDHHSPQDSSQTSAYLRVAGPAAGGRRGFVFTPRIGEEVIVSFEDGDPDKPLIIGSVYSRQNPTSDSPDSKPFAGIIKSDGDSDSNRITFEDKSGSAKLEINAKKDLNFEVGRNLNIIVEDDIIIRENNEFINITKDIKNKAGGNIISATAGPIVNTAGLNISSMALGGVINIAGGMVSNKAGGTLTNTAVLSVENKAGGALVQMAGSILANTSTDSILYSGEKVCYDGSLAVINISLADIINNAGEEIKQKTMLHKVKIDESSETETGDYNIKALLPKEN